MLRNFRLVSQAMDIILRVLETLEPLMEGFPGDAEVLSCESGILFSHCIIEDYPFHSQPLMGFKAQEVCHPSPLLISILRDNGLGFKEIETGWLSHPGNSL
jgi:hypothetical protein